MQQDRKLVDDRERLEREGFEGFVTVGGLRALSLSTVPEKPGVYVFLRDVDQSPSFFNRSRGGHFKGQNPTVSVSTLENAWVPGAKIVYIGKAGGVTGSPTLRTRLRQYLSFGAGEPVAHWGGRYIWQLVDAEDLIVCWQTTGEQEPRDVEREVLEDFERAHGCLPFANLKK
jgi:hypothetical protein